MTQRVAVIGMGQMGSGMAGRLTEPGFDVLGYDIDPDTAAGSWARRQVAMAETLKDGAGGPRDDSHQPARSGGGPRGLARRQRHHRAGRARQPDHRGFHHRSRHDARRSARRLRRAAWLSSIARSAAARPRRAPARWC